MYLISYKFNPLRRIRMLNAFLRHYITSESLQHCDLRVEEPLNKRLRGSQYEVCNMIRAQNKALWQLSEALKGGQAPPDPHFARPLGAVQQTYTHH